MCTAPTDHRDDPHGGSLSTMSSPQRFLVSSCLVASIVTGGCDVVPPTNPFDPDNAANPAPGVVQGAIRAVYAPTIPDRPDEDAPASAGACARQTGDHSGFVVVLRGLTDDGGDAVNAPTAETNETGAFRFEDVPVGSYSLAFVRAGFEVPPIAEVDVGIAETKDVGTFCALNRTGPARPTLGPLPTTVRPTEPAPDVVVVGADPACDPGAAGCPVEYEFRQSVAGRADALVRLPSSTPLTVQLVLGDGTGARQTVDVAVVAVDAMGNRSEPATASVVVDGTAPGAPTGLTGSTGRDRVQLSWAAGPVADGDDAPARYFVWYGLVARAAADGCDFGRPTFDDDGNVIDDNGRPAFALEGEAPLATTATAQALSGIAPGTDVFVHVAAIDAAGNAGCYSPPLSVRPDEIAFSPPTRVVSAALAGALRVVAVDDPRHDGLVVVRGSAGASFVAPAAGAVTAPAVDVDQTPALDVELDADRTGRVAWVASGVLGLRRVPLDDAGVADLDAVTTVDDVDDVTAVAALPGRLAVGTAAGVRVIDPGAPPAQPITNDGHGAVRALRTWGRLVLSVRGDGGLQVRVVAQDRGVPDDRAPLPVVATSALLAGVPQDALVHDDALWLAFSSSAGAVVVALDLRPCGADGADGAGDPGCLAVRGRRSLAVTVPSTSSGMRLVGLDDAVGVVAGDQQVDGVHAAVFALRTDAALSLIGRADLGVGDPRAAFVEPGGLCVGVASGADGDALLCTRTISTYVVDEERRAASGRVVVRARLAAGAAWTVENDLDIGAAVGRHRLATLGDDEGARALVPPGPAARAPSLVGGAVLPDGGFVVVDDLARVWSLSPRRAALAPAGDLGPELARLAPDAGDARDPDFVGYTGFVERRGSTLVVGLVGRDDQALVARVPLALADGDATVGGLAASDVVTVAGIASFTKLVLRDGRALLPTKPHGLVAVSLGTPADPALFVDDDAGVDRAAEPGSFLADLVVTAGAAAPRLVGVGVVGGAASLVEFTPAQGGATTTTLQAPGDVARQARSMCALQDALVVALGARGVQIVRDVDGRGRSYAAVSALPSVTQVVEPVAGVRGVLAADGRGGVVFSVLR